MTSLRERLERKIESEATKRSLRQCSTGQDDLNKAISWYLKVGFEDGAHSLLPLVLELSGIISRIQAQSELFNFAKDETRVYKINDYSIEALQAIEKFVGEK